MLQKLNCKIRSDCSSPAAADLGEDEDSELRLHLGWLLLVVRTLKESSSCNSRHTMAYFLLLQNVPRHGRLIARNPVLTIALSLLVTSLTFIGFINFHWESNSVKLWLPAGSEFVRVCIFVCQLNDKIKKDRNLS